jgi:acyl-CoA synthetase (AMP-forming)/AMP-acid ligase II
MWWRLMEEPSLSERNLSSLRLLLYGGAPMPPALLARLQRAFPAATFGNGYGMTETCSMLTYIDGADIFAHPDSVGRPLPITDTRAVDPQTKRDVGMGEVGELWVKGAQVSAGYWCNPEATGALFEDGWLRTGDAVSIESDGFITLRDRLKDVVKRGGESIYSFEIENVLFQFPAVLDAAVVGIPDEVYGERVKAVVVLKPGQHATESDIKEFCRQHLGRFKVPSIIAFRSELPRNPGGKVLKKLLKEAQPAETG